MEDNVDSRREEPNEKKVEIKVGNTVKEVAAHVIGAAVGVALVHAAPYVYDFSPITQNLDLLKFGYTLTHLVKDFPVIMSIIGAVAGAGVFGSTAKKFMDLPRRN